MNNTSESNKKLDKTKPVKDYSIEELNHAYLKRVEDQIARLDLEEPVFRQIDQLNRERSKKYPLIPNLMVVDLARKIQQLSRVIYKYISKKFKKHHSVYSMILLTTSLSVLTLLIVNIVYVVLVSESISFNFSKVQTCVISPSLLPDFLHYPKDSTFRISRSPSWSISGVTIFSGRLCARPLKGPLSNVRYLNMQADTILGGLKFSKNITVATTSYPTLKAINLTEARSKNLSLLQPIKFNLLSLDKTFEYVLSANGKSSLCARKKLTLSCNLSPLQLSYDTNYQLALDREFNKQTIAAAYKDKVQTITAVAVTQSSIAPGSTVYNVPTDIALEASKTLVSVAGVELSYSATNKTVQVPVTTTYSGNNITVSFTNPLPRQTEFNLHIVNATASDQSQFEQPYNLAFTTSGGPAVTGSDIPSFGLASGQALDVNFNQGLSSSQDPSSYTTLYINNTVEPASITARGSTLTIVPKVSYPVCTTVAIKLTAAAESQYGISGNSAWSYTSRSHCYRTFSIGTSVKGRPITAYQFGSGQSMVLYIGAMEGNEQNASELLNQWIPNIDANPSKIPAGRTLVIIPTINPDGFAADARLNADGVDLNRNFPANNWSEQVTEPLANTVWTNDGGPYPLSEPESQAIASYTENNQPTLTLTMHSHGGIVEANDAGNSVALGSEYANLADYRAIPTYAIGSFFNYTTTGAYEDWMNNKLNLPALEVELESATNDEYSRNLPALWAMAQIPN